MRTPKSETFAARMLGSLAKVGTSEGADRGWETRRGRSAVEETPGEGRSAAAPEEVADSGKIALDWLAPTQAPTAESEAESGKGIALDWLKPAKLPTTEPREQPAAAAPEEPAEAPAGMTPEQAQQWADKTRFTGRTKVQRAEKKQASATLRKQQKHILAAGPPTESQGAWSEAATATSNAIGAKAVADTLASGREHAWFVDADTGEPVGRYQEGGKKSVELGVGLLSIDPKRAYISGHTHPGPAGPSSQDLVFFMAYPQITRMVIHDIVGNVYEIEKPADWEGQSKGVPAILSAGKAYHKTIMSHVYARQLLYQAQGGYQGKSAKEIEGDLERIGSESVHAAMGSVAKSLGLTYRRRNAE